MFLKVGLDHDKILILYVGFYYNSQWVEAI